MTCKTCKWWKSTDQSQSMCTPDEVQSCTRYPPIWDGKTGCRVWWPITPGSLIACGEYKDKEIVVPIKVQATWL